MADHTGIEWAEATWNPVVGCSVVSPGCTSCYAMKMAARIEAMGGKAGEKYRGLTQPSKAGPVWTGTVRLDEGALDQPMRWRRPRRIFVNSMSDLFHESLVDEQIGIVFEVMRNAWWHQFIVLTKRAGRMRDWVRGRNAGNWAMWLSAWPLPNVTLGVSIEDQQRADERVPLLLATPAALRVVSAEPLLGPIDLNSTLGGTLWIGGQRGCDGMHHGIGTPDCPKELHHHHDERCGRGLDGVIIGGENGPRPMHPDWARSLRDQCTAADVPFFFKQWGTHRVVYDRDREDPDWRRCGEVERATPKGRWLNLAGGMGFHGERVVRVDRCSKATAGRLLDGRTWDQLPEVRHA